MEQCFPLERWMLHCDEGLAARGALLIRLNNRSEGLKYLSVAHDTLPDRELDEQWLVKNYGLAVRVHAHIPSRREAIDGPGCAYSLSPLAKLNKHVPMDSTLLSKLVHHL